MQTVQAWAAGGRHRPFSGYSVFNTNKFGGVYRSEGNYAGGSQPGSRAAISMRIGVARLLVTKQ